MYRIDAFTKNSVGTRFPENTFDAADERELVGILKDLMRPISGIVLVEVWDPNSLDDQPLKIYHFKDGVHTNV